MKRRSPEYKLNPDACFFWSIINAKQFGPFQCFERCPKFLIWLLICSEMIFFCIFCEIRTRFINKNRYDLGLINMKSSSLILDEKSAWSFKCLIFEAKEH